MFTDELIAVPNSLWMKGNIDGIANSFFAVLIVTNLADGEWNFPTLPLLVILVNFLVARLLNNCGRADIDI
jgi:hypothetical protein